MMRALAISALLSVMPVASSAGYLPAPVALVQINNNYFEPGAVHVDTGGTVLWVARAGGHTITFEDGSFSSQPLRSGDVVPRTFDEPGAFPYRCLVHQPRMTGVVTVG